RARALANAVVRVRRDLDGWNAFSGNGQALIKLESRHPRHLHVGDQARRTGEKVRAQKLLRRCDGLDLISERPHEPLYRLAYRLIVVDDRNQRFRLWHSTSCTRTCAGNDAMRPKRLGRTIFTASHEDETNSTARRLY